MTAKKLGLLALMFVLGATCWPEDSELCLWRRRCRPRRCRVRCCSSNKASCNTGPTQKVHTVLILDDDHATFGPCVKVNGELMASLLAGQIDEELRGTTTLILSSRDALNRANLLKSIADLKVGRNEALFCYYSGLGASSRSRGSSLKMGDGSQMPRRELAQALARKGARLTVLVTDVVQAFAPPTAEELLVGVEGPQVLAWLLLQHAGVVDIESARPNEAGLCQKSLGDDGITEQLGSVFTREFFKECTLGRSQGKRPVTWEGFFSELSTNVNQAATALLHLADTAPRQGQNPVAVRLTARPDRLPPGVNPSPPNLARRTPPRPPRQSEKRRRPASTMR